MTMADSSASHAAQSDSAEDLARRGVESQNVKEALELLRSAGALVDETTGLSAWIEGVIGLKLYQSQDFHEARLHFERSEGRWNGVPFEDSPRRRAVTLCNYANLLCDLGAYRASRSRLEATLEIERRILGQEAPEYARTLANFARLLRITGYAEEACRHARQAAEILEASAVRRDQMDALYAKNILGMALMDSGRWSEAVTLFRALLVQAPQAEAPEIYYSVLNNIGWSLYGMGDYELAASWESEALDIVRDRTGDAARIAEATLLTNLAAVRHKLEDFEGACIAYAEARAVLQLVVADGRHPQMASIYCNWGAALYRLGRFAETRSHYEQALVLREAFDGEAHQATADVRFHLAELTLAEHNADEALKCAVATLALPGLHSSPDSVWRVFNLISRALEAKGQGRLAILFGKQAVEILEAMRGGILPLGRHADEQFTLSRATCYRTLADQLVSDNRLAEAEHVLERLRAAEQNELLGRDSGLARSAQPGFSRQESEWQKEYGNPLSRMAALRARLMELVEIGEDAELVAVRRDIEEAANELSASVAALVQHIESDAVRVAVESIGSAGPSLRPDDLFLHFFPAGSHYWVLRRDGKGNTARSKIEADEATIRNLVSDFRHALSNPSAPLQIVQAACTRLNDLLLRPILGDQPRHKCLHLWLDGALRFMAPAALFDGTHYLVEKVSVSLYSPFGNAGAARRSLNHHGIAGFALGREIKGFAPLPFAVKEVETIIGDESGNGLFSGERFTDDLFTSDNLKRAAIEFGGLLIATHFALRPADLTRSGLLMGAGELMTVRQLAELDFSGLSLMTISSCETGTAGLFGDAAVLQSFADRLMLRGAGAVLASLWRVADASSARLIIEFYARLANDSTTDFAAALAQAQQAMIRGEATMAWPKGKTLRGIGSKNDEDDSAAIDFRHPYYWAPFVLLGEAGCAQ